MDPASFTVRLASGNPLVLIHPPLYYRLAALCAWPLARAGIRPETAALIAGRTISLSGWAATLAGAFFLARFQARAADRGVVGRASGRGDAGLRRR